MTKIEVRDLELKLNDTDDKTLELHGYISTDAPSAVLQKGGKAWREIIPKGVFNRAIERATMQKGIDLLFNHDKKLILSSTTNGSLEVEEDEVGLYFSAKVSKTSWGKDLYELVKDRIIKGLSFGMIVRNDNWSMGRDGIALRTILDIDLFEISAVQRPAYPESLLELRDIEVVQVDVPEDLEERDMTGVGPVSEKEIVNLFNQIYEGMTLIAGKIDNLDSRFTKQEESQLTEELQEAKALLTESKALAKAQAELVNANVSAAQEEKEEANKVVQSTSAATPNTEVPKPKKDSSENEAEKRDEDLGEVENVEAPEEQVVEDINDDSAEEAQEKVETPSEFKEEASEELVEALDKSEEVLDELKDELEDDPKVDEPKVDEETRSLLDEYKEFIKSMEVVKID